MDPITAALASAATAGFTSVAGEAVKDAYGQLKATIAARFPQLAVHVHALEARPDSQLKQSSLGEEVYAAGAQNDAELLQLAMVLVEAIRTEAPEAAIRAGVNLDQIRAGGSVEIEDAQGQDAGVRGRDWDVAGDIRIRQARAGGGSDPNR